MVNAMARAIHAVRRDNVVIAGGLAPFGGTLRVGGTAGPDSAARVHARDAVHVGGRQAAGDLQRADRVRRLGPPPVHLRRPDARRRSTPTTPSLGDLGEMRALLMRGRSRRPHRRARQPEFWVTEFSYDSRPPDPKGVPLALHARWVSESLYRMWQDGVSLVTWFYLRDGPFRPARSSPASTSEKRDRERQAEAGAARVPLPVRRVPREGRRDLVLGAHARRSKKAVVVEQQVGSDGAASRRRLSTATGSSRGAWPGAAQGPAQGPRRRRRVGPLQPQGLEGPALLPLRDHLLTISAGRLERAPLSSRSRIGLGIKMPRAGFEPALSIERAWPGPLVDGGPRPV